MVRFFCPACWSDFKDDIDRCPNCSSDIRGIWHSKDYIEKLIMALSHPEKTTPLRAAWILGKLKDKRSVSPLIALIKKTDDVYLAVTAIKALGEIGTDDAFDGLESLMNHPARMVKEAVNRILNPHMVADQDHKSDGADS